jgi:hypothetical protein
MWDKDFGFTTLEEWFQNPPELGNEYFPKVDEHWQSYKDWLLQHPEGYAAT